MYRLYIDETGHADLNASEDPNHQYLSLTGIGMLLNDARDIAYPEIESIKTDIFNSHPDDPVILHRKDIVVRKYPFHALRNQSKQEEFNDRVLTLLRDLNYIVFTAVIDKLEHLNRYQIWRYDPYHYCLEVILERYVLWLRRRNATGDVVAEARTKSHDRRLEKCYSRLYRRGSDFVNQKHFQARLTSKDLKTRPKTANVAGLQLADLLANPCARHLRHQVAGSDPLTGFPADILSVLENTKYDRSPGGRIAGWGTKWLP